MRTSHLASLVAFTFVIGCSPPKQTTVNQTSAAVSLPVEQGGWSLSYGEINPPCSTQGNGLIDNPIIASFNTGVSTGGGTGTQLDTAALNFGCECCTCVGYQKDFAVGSLNSDGWALTGYFHSQRSNDPFTVASMRIDLISGGTEVGNVTLAGEQRTNNCVGGSERTIVVSDPGTFSLRLSSISPNTSFDTLRI